MSSEHGEIDAMHIYFGHLRKVYCSYKTKNNNFKLHVPDYYCFAWVTLGKNTFDFDTL